MLKGLIKGLAYGFLIALISGCTMRTYSQVKERVDQDTTGNKGYLMGKGAPEDRSGIKQTRKIYVLELQSKEKEPVEPALTSTAKPTPSAEVSEGAPSRNVVNVPTIEESSTEMENESAASASAVQKSLAKESAAGEAATAAPGEYIVEKGDTLQKISKKVYDTYRLWNKIYQANKERIKDPNKIKPGTKLTIPPK